MRDTFFFRFWLVGPLLLTCLSGPINAETDEANARHTDDYLNKDLVFYENSVLQAEQELRAVPRTDPTAEQRFRALRGTLQGLAAARAKIGDADGAIAAFSKMGQAEQRFGYDLNKPVGNEATDLAAIDAAHVEDAVKAIAQAAQSRQVVVLNEAHHAPFDRILALRLARALRKEGFEYLACETFRGLDEHVLNKGYVVKATGPYAREPTYAKFLTDAISDGWKFVSYEPSGPASLHRESGMAKNLVDRIFAKDPKAKVFIYVGYSHAKKVPSSTGDDDNSKMAAQLSRMTGIDPLTVNQTTLFDQFNNTRQSRLYAHAARKTRSRDPIVLIQKDGSPVKLTIDDSAYDIEVVHPAYVNDAKTGRPEWLSKLFVPRDVPKELLPTKGRRAIYAYLKNTESDAVPLDVILLTARSPPPKLMLPPGEFVFEVEDEQPPEQH